MGIAADYEGHHKGNNHHAAGQLAESLYEDNERGDGKQIDDDKQKKRKSRSAWLNFGKQNQMPDDDDEMC